MNENNVFIGKKDETYTVPIAETCSATTKVYNNSNVTTTYDPLPFDYWKEWLVAPQRRTYGINLGEVDELIIYSRDNQIKIPVTDDFIDNLTKFLKELAYIKE